MRTHGQKILSLIDAFPWGEPGFPPRLPGQEDLLVHAWIREKFTAEAAATALALKSRIDPIVRAVEQEICHGRARRFVARIDASHLTKSPESVLEKMAREWDGSSPPPIGFRDIRGSFSDLARFRIVANFLSDAEAVRRAIEVPFGTPMAAAASADQCALYADFRLDKCAFEDSIHVPIKLRQSPERSFKGVFEPRIEGQPISVEVQVQTLLQEAWDKKQHVLVYEPRRRGEPVDDRVERELEEMSGLLSVADSTFDRLRADLQGRD